MTHMDCTTIGRKKQSLTLDDIAAMTKIYLVPREVAQVIGCHPYTISVMARDPATVGLLGFPVIRTGTRTKIPRERFLDFMGYKKEVTT